jgi:hypothetical protein
MTPSEALTEVRGYAGAGRIRLTRHAERRMEDRGVVFRDVRSALMNAGQCSALPEERWKVWGPDTSGDELTLVILLEDGVIVVTMF